jgi:hypothetical protein
VSEARGPGEVGRDVATVDLADNGDAQVHQCAADRVVLGEAGFGLGGVGPGEKHGVGVVEPARESHAPQVTGDTGGVVVVSFEVERETVGGVSFRQRGKVTVRGAGQGGDGFDAAAEEPSRGSERLSSGVEESPGAGGVEAVLGGGRVLLPAVESMGAVPRRGTLGDRSAGW